MSAAAAPRRPCVVTLGGGTGQSTLLAALRGLPVDVTAVAGVTDNGGHSGFLRRVLGIPQVGDLRQCLEAVAPPGFLARLVGHRFREGDLDGVQVGNLLLAALCRQTGRLSRAAEAMRALLGSRERVLPVSDGDAQLGAELPGRRIVVGEWEIIRALRKRGRTDDVRLFHRPVVQALPAVRENLRRADFVLLAPGSLRTALASLLLARGVRAALADGRARIVQFLNLMTQPGQTDGFTACDHVRELARYLPRLPDVVVAHRGPLPSALVAAYRRMGATPVVDDLAGLAGPLVVRAALAERPDARALRAYRRGGASFAAGPHLLRHAPAALAKVLTSLFRHD